MALLLWRSESLDRLLSFFPSWVVSWYIVKTGHQAVPSAQTWKDDRLSLDLRNLGEVCSQDGEHLLFSWLQDNKIHFKILGCSCFTDQERRGCFRCLIWLAAVVQICSGCFFCSSVNTSRNRKGLMPKKETSKVPKLESIWHQNRL